MRPLSIYYNNIPIGPTDNNLAVLKFQIDSTCQVPSLKLFFKLIIIYRRIHRKAIHFGMLHVTWSDKSNLFNYSKQKVDSNVSHCSMTEKCIVL